MSEKLEMRATTQGTTRQGVPAQPVDTTHRYPAVGSIDDVRSEIDDAWGDIREFYQEEPDDVMRMCSGHMARLGEISKDIRRIESSAPALKRLRAQELEHTIDELWKQYQIASRLQSVREMDWKMTAGGQ